MFRENVDCAMSCLRPRLFTKALKQRRAEVLPRITDFIIIDNKIQIYDRVLFESQTSTPL